MLRLTGEGIVTMNQAQISCTFQHIVTELKAFWVHRPGEAKAESGPTICIQPHLRGYGVEVHCNYLQIINFMTLEGDQ